MAERTARLQREREANARRAVLDERVRIAREPRDVVADHVGLMDVPAGAARCVPPCRPEQAMAMLAAIETSSREAVRAMHRLLGFLRREPENDPLAPQPSVRRLDALIDEMRAAGLPDSLTIAGEARPLPPGVDLPAYRIVQEALTNTLKHAEPATATVTLRYGDPALEIEVIDDGVAALAAAAGGVGPIGLRERGGRCGGRLRTGRHPGPGFVVRARLPLAGSLA